ncbi:MAG: DUF5666 domain-containing protein [Burkholderiaceae bacterium]
MKPITLLKHALICSLVSLAGCGVGGVDGDVTPGGGGTACPGCEPVAMPAAATIGPVSATAPLTVNGIVFSPAGSPALNIADGDDDGRGAQPGMMARVQGGLGAGGTTGTVTSLEINAEIRGPIQSLDEAAGRFTIMGITVQANANTTFEYQPAGVDPMPLKVGDSLQVHGYAYGDQVLATRIVKRVTNNVFKTTGVVSYTNCPNCTTFGRAFRLGSLLVSVPESVVLRGVSWPVPEGTVVRVKAAEAPTNGFVTATEISDYGGAPMLADAMTKVRGYVSNLNGSAFKLHGIASTLAAQAVFTGGSAADFANGRLVEVQGIYRGGMIQVTAVLFLN